MKDKEKLIEEMAKALCPVVQKYQCQKLCTNIGNCQELKEVCDKIFKVVFEDSVVLSREELNEIINQTKETEKNYYKKVVIPQERKETAEKVFQRLFEEHDIFNDNDVIIVWQIKDVLKSLAKQFGVEIKE